MLNTWLISLPMLPIVFCLRGLAHHVQGVLLGFRGRIVRLLSYAFMPVAVSCLGYCSLGAIGGASARKSIKELDH